ncbi:hypothetical protein GCM10009759_07870 [Kitasatospora saccharophila]|uniref:SseB protein N-terminal domain-containing protein n=1 Tax=Kitasatospora saccharophila TaxID=407973 RepID=A0ABN2W904_9ACTN
MQQRYDAVDPEPAEPAPAGVLLVPVKVGPLGCTARLFRTPLGDRTAVAFTSVVLLARVCGAAQYWAEFSEPALRTLVAPLDVTLLTIDPQLVAAAPRSRPQLDAAFAASLLEPSAATRPVRAPSPSQAVPLPTD